MNEYWMELDADKGNISRYINLSQATDMERHGETTLKIFMPNNRVFEISNTKETIDAIISRLFPKGRMRVNK